MKKYLGFILSALTFAVVMGVTAPQVGAITNYPIHGGGCGFYSWSPYISGWTHIKPCLQRISYISNLVLETMGYSVSDLGQGGVCIRYYEVDQVYPFSSVIDSHHSFPNCGGFSQSWYVNQYNRNKIKVGGVYRSWEDENILGYAYSGRVYSPRLWRTY